MKRYREFLEDKEKKFILVLKDADLDADYEFHKTITDHIDEYKIAERNLDSGKYPHTEHNNRIFNFLGIKSKEIVSHAYKYFRKTFRENNLNCEKFWFGQFIGAGNTETCYIVYFYAKESDLEKINNYYGITNRDNIKSPDYNDQKNMESWNSIKDNKDRILQENKLQ